MRHQRQTVTVWLTAMVLLAPCAFGAMRDIPSKSKDPYVGAIVIDADTGVVLFEDKADEPVYPASVVKLLDLLIIVEKLEAGDLKLTDWVYATRDAALMGGTQVWLKEGEACTVDDLLAALMTRSANDAAVALAMQVAGSKKNFVTLMNRRAAELGMTHSSFHSPHGLPPEPGQEPDISTARDIATLSRELVKHKTALRYTATKERIFREGKPGHVDMRSYNPLLWDFPDCDGLKTGYFRKAGFSISVTATRNNRRVIAVMMGCQSKVTRNTRARELLSQGFLDLPPLAPPPKAAPKKPPRTEKTSKPKQGGSRAIKSFFVGLLRLLALIVAAAVIAGLILGIRWVYIKRRDNWKYKM